MICSVRMMINKHTSKNVIIKLQEKCYDIITHQWIPIEMVLLTKAADGTQSKEEPKPNQKFLHFGRHFFIC